MGREKEAMLIAVKGKAQMGDVEWSWRVHPIRVLHNRVSGAPGEVREMADIARILCTTLYQSLTARGSRGNARGKKGAGA